MVPPADPKKLRKAKFNPQVIAELEELGILDDVSDLIFSMPNATIPEIQQAIADRFHYLDISTPEINLLQNGFKRVPVVNGRGANKGRRKPNSKSPIEQLAADYGIKDDNDDNL